MTKRHSGGKVGKAGKILQDKKSTSRQKTTASKVLNDHKKRKH